MQRQQLSHACSRCPVSAAGTCHRMPDTGPFSKHSPAAIVQRPRSYIMHMLVATSRTIRQLLLRVHLHVHLPQGHPAILTDGVVLLSRAPRLDPTWRTPGAVVARLDSFLTFFTDAQLVDVLRALGRFTALHEPATDASPSASNAGGGSGMQGTDVAGAVQLPPPVTVPLEVLLPKNAQAFSSSTHADGDLLARIGQRLSRGLLSQPRGRQGQVLARLGLKD